MYVVSLGWRSTTHSTVGTSPHLLEAELLDSGLVRGDLGAFDTDRVLLDSFGRVDGDLVVCLDISEVLLHRKRAEMGTYRISRFHAEIVVLEIDVDIGENKLFVSVDYTLQEGRGALTSSRIFFQMIRVISSPSSSTTGFLTLIRSQPAGTA